MKQSNVFMQISLLRPWEKKQRTGISSTLQWGYLCRTFNRSAKSLRTYTEIVSLSRYELSFSLKREDNGKWCLWTATKWTHPNDIVWQNRPENIHQLCLILHTDDESRSEQKERLDWAFECHYRISRHDQSNPSSVNVTRRGKCPPV
jgi:hypothetical protein